MRKSRWNRFTSILSLAIILVYATTPVSAIETAGDLFVDLDAATFTTGDPVWTNASNLYADFEAVANPMSGLIETTPVIFFDGQNDAFVGGSLDDPAAAPEGLTGIDPTRSIEVWAFNPSIASEETLVSWGNRGGPDGTNMAFNYGNHGNFGAVGHWGGGGPDVGWIDNDFTPGAPEANTWHHLVYTYDEETARVYSDGELWNEEDMQFWGGLDTYPDPAIAIASQWEADGLTLTGALKGSLAIGRVRIHDGVLTDAQILSNYNEEKDSFVGPPPPPDPVPEPLPMGPIHRYSFTSDVSDSVGGADGTVVDEGDIPNAVFTDGMLDLSENIGEGSAGITEDAYVDLPNGVISAAVNSGTSGAISLEWWATVSETHTWQRFGDFGTSNNGEDTSDGGNASEYILVTPNSGRYANGLEITNHPATNAAEPNVGLTGPFPNEEEAHVVAVYDQTDTSVGANGTMSLYLDGEFIGSNEIHSDIDLLTFEDDNNWLGRSQWNDPVFDGSFNEFRIYDYSLTTNQVLGNFQSGPDTVNVGMGGDYNGDGVIDAADIDLQAVEMKAANPNLEVFDENGDGAVNEVDRLIWVHDYAGTWVGDSDLNGLFNSSDLVAVFTAGKYETGDTTAIWAEGDWNGDMLFGSGDLVAAFTDGGYEAGARNEAVAAVPEPIGLVLLLMGTLATLSFRRRRRRE